jgi:hypothetical protein
MANELKQVYGAQQTVISMAGALANGANTYVADGITTTSQLDNTVNNYPYAQALLQLQDTFAAAPTAGGTIDLYMIQDDVDGTIDESPLPGATDIDYLAKYVGSWTVDNQDVAYVKPINISLEGVQKARFFIKNNTGQQISYTSNPITVKIKPFSFAPT